MPFSQRYVVIVPRTFPLPSERLLVIVPLSSWRTDAPLSVAPSSTPGKSGAKCSPKLFHGGNAVAHVIVEYVNVSPFFTGIDTGSVATVVGWPLGVPYCVPASVSPSTMIAPFAGLLPPALDLPGIA